MSERKRDKTGLYLFFDKVIIINFAKWVSFVEENWAFYKFSSSSNYVLFCKKYVTKETTPRQQNKRTKDKRDETLVFSIYTV